MSGGRLYFDIETSPCVGYFWRPGYNLNITYENIIHESAIICIAYKWEGEDKVHSLTWDRDRSDRKMLERFVKVANKADELIAHNGDRFDLPWIRTRCLFHRVPMFPEYSTVDTLKKARGQFKFNSNRLDYIAGYLEVGRKMDTGGFGLWKDVMDGDKGALTKMVDYCEQDVKVLERVYLEMENYLKSTVHYGVLHGGWKHHCPRCASSETKRDKVKTTAAGTVKVQMKCKKCSKYFTLSENALNASRRKEALAMAGVKQMD